jgi:uncharacterized protein YjbJ (UPF0337 family)
VTDEHAKGTVNKATGKIQEWVGKLTGSRKTQLKGDVKQVQGSAQQGLGDAQDTVRGPADRD